MQLHNSLAFLYFSPTPQTQLSPPTPSTSISWQFPLVSMVTVWEGVGLGEGGGTVGKKKWTRNPIQAFPVLTLVCVCVSVCVYVCVCVCTRVYRVTGGELFEDIVAREYYSEADAR